MWDSDGDAEDVRLPAPPKPQTQNSCAAHREWSGNGQKRPRMDFLASFVARSAKQPDLCGSTRSSFNPIQTQKPSKRTRVSCLPLIHSGDPSHGRRGGARHHRKLHPAGHHPAGCHDARCVGHVVVCVAWGCGRAPGVTSVQGTNQLWSVRRSLIPIARVPHYHVPHRNQLHIAMHICALSPFKTSVFAWCKHTVRRGSSAAVCCTCCPRWPC